MLRKVFVEIEQSDPDLYEVEKSVALPELKCGDTGHAYVVLKLMDGNAAEPAAFSCELKFQVRHRDDPTSPPPQTANRKPQMYCLLRTYCFYRPPNYSAFFGYWWVGGLRRRRRW